MAQADWEAAEDVGSHDQGRPETSLRSRVFDYARWRKDWVKVPSEPGVSPAEALPIQLVMPVQPDPSEYEHK